VDTLVLDLGANSLNVSHVRCHDGLYTLHQSNKYENMGGKQFDQAIVEFAITEFKRKFKTDISQNKRSIQKLHMAAERTRRSLTRQETAPLQVESLYDGMDYNGTIIRARFDTLCDPIYTKCKEAIKDTLLRSKLNIDQIEQVLLIGGCSRMPTFKTQMKSIFTNNTIFRSEVEPDEAISIGLALQARLLLDNNIDVEMVHINPKVFVLTKSIGIKCPNFKPLIHKGASLPLIRQFSFPISDVQTEAFVKLYQDEDIFVEIILNDLEAAAGRQVDVIICIENDHVVIVTVSEKSSGQEVEVKVQ
jgi:heat shock protein 1/8